MSEEAEAREVSRHVRDLATMSCALWECLEFAEDQSDVIDGDDGQPAANRAMQIATTIKDALRSCGEEV